MGDKNSNKSNALPNQYEIERIVDVKGANSKRKFKVHWKDFRDEEDTWENEKQLREDGIGEMIDAFLESKSSNSKKTSKKSPENNKNDNNNKENESHLLSQEQSNKTRSRRKHRNKLNDKKNTESSQMSSPSSNTKNLKETDNTNENETQNQEKEEIIPEKEEQEQEQEHEEQTKEFEVEYIFGLKKTKNGTKFHVKWLGYPKEESTWEMEENLSGAKDSINEYLKKKKEEEIKKKKKNSNEKNTSNSKASINNNNNDGNTNNNNNNNNNDNSDNRIDNIDDIDNTSEEKEEIQHNKLSLPLSKPFRKSGSVLNKRRIIEIEADDTKSKKKKSDKECIQLIQNLKPTELREKLIGLVQFGSKEEKQYIRDIINSIV